MTQQTTEKIPYRPLGTIVTMVKNIGLEVTHYHEELIFVEHNAFLIQMGEKGEDVFIWFNVDCDQEKISEIMEGLEQQAALVNILLVNHGSYKMGANGSDETLQIEFLQK